ncbi:putative Ig domain-containing protein [Chloroflexota bacterium]
MKNWNIMKGISIILSALIITLMFIGLDVSHVARGVAHPSLYYTSEELQDLKLLKTAPTHRAMWNNIRSWADAHISDAPPVPSGAASDWMDWADTVRIFLETMSFMYNMTDNTTYAEAAKTWMLSIAGLSSWSDFKGNIWQVRSWMGIAFATGYYDFHDYLTPTERETIRDKMILEMNIVYNHYSPVGSTYFPVAYPNHASLVAASLGMGALALGSDYTGSGDWLDFSILTTEYVFGLLGEGGGWPEGPSYAVYSMDALVQFLDVLKRVNGIDLFSTHSDFLSGAAYYLIYMTVDDDQSGRTVAMMMEDYSGRQEYFSNTNLALNYVYRLAREYSDGYAQTFANTYAGQNFMQSYVWKDPALLPLPIAELPLDHYFSGIGYVIWRVGWENDDLVFLFKSGRSMGHAHSDQNSYTIYQGGRPITSGPGYVNTWKEYDLTKYANAITVNGTGQAQEPGDLGTAPLGTTGVIQELTINNYFRYVRGDASAPYLGLDTGHYLTESGALDKWLRHVVYIDDPGYFIIYDEVAATVPSRFDWYFHGRNIYNEAANLSLNANLITYTKGNARIEIEVAEPTSFNHDIIFDSGPYDRAWEYIQLRPSTNVTSAQFLTTLFADDSLSTGAVSADRISQGNMTGVIINYGRKKDLILFSQDGLPVDQYVELGDLYLPIDGNSYTFNGTQVLASFDTYEVIKIAQMQPPVLEAVGDQSVDEGQLLQFTIAASDADGDPLSYSASNLPAGASFNSTSRNFSWTPGFSQAGNYPDVHFEVTDGTLTDSENITISVRDVSTPPPPPTSGGGGGGGGGAPTVPLSPGKTDVTKMITTEGLFTTEVEALSDDGRGKLIIPKNTIGLKSNGFSLNQITMIQSEQIAPYEGYHILSLYILGPHGATFYPSITLSVTYDPADLPQGVNEEEAIIAIWDEMTDEWIKLEGSVVDVANHTISGLINHFTTFAVIIPQRIKTVEIKPAIKDSVSSLDDNESVQDKSEIKPDEFSPIIEKSDSISKEPNVTFRPEISYFNVTTYFDPRRDKDTFARVICELSNLNESTFDAEMVIKVSMNSEPLEEIILPLNQVNRGTKTINFDYEPSQGWNMGIYTLRAELYVNGVLLQSTDEQRVEITDKSVIPVSNWLPIVIWVFLISFTVFIVMGIMIYHKRHRLPEVNSGES